MRSKSFLIFFLLMSCHFSGLAHDSTRHKKKLEPPPVVVMESSHAAAPVDSALAVLQASPPLQEFPTLHPLVVHIPIVFLLMAAAMQLVSLFLFKRELTWTSWVILLIGFVGAYASSSLYHAHTTGLSAGAQHLLEEHEAYAEYTQWLAAAALVIQTVHLFFLRRRVWLNVTVTIFAIGAAIAVALAGHHGAELVHKHGIGAKGYLLEQHHH